MFMKKNYKFIVIFLSVMLFFISIGYAVYSTSLDINGTANINRSIWSVHYDENSTEVLSGNANGFNRVSPTSGPVVSSDLKKISFETTLNVNEETSFTVDVVNDGTFTARVSSINLIVSSRSDSNSSYSTLANIGTNKWSNDYLDVSILWVQGSRNILDTIDLEPSTTKKMVFTVRYKQPDDYNLLPSENMSFKFDFSVLYSQSNNLSGDVNYTPKVASSISTPVEFISALSNADTVLRLDSDIDLTDYDSIDIDNNVTIEFGGNRLTVVPNSIEVKNGGFLILEDSNGEGGISSDRGVVNVMNGGTLIVNGGKYITTNNTRGSGIYVDDGGKLIINDGVIDAAYYSIGTDGSVDITINGGELNSSSTNLSGSWAYSVKLISGTFTMNGGKITGIQGGLALDGSVDAIINNGEINVHESSDGANDGFYNIYVTGDSSLDIYDGSFTNDGTRSVIYTISSNDIELYGGAFIAKGNTLFTGNNIKVFNGSYSHDVSDYLVSGSLNYSNDFYNVGD